MAEIWNLCRYKSAHKEIFVNLGTENGKLINGPLGPVVFVYSTSKILLESLAQVEFFILYQQAYMTTICGLINDLFTDGYQYVNGNGTIIVVLN